jgi:hypothetical protein
MMMAVSSRCSCRRSFTQPHILPVPCEYIFSLMLFTVNNLDNFHTNSDVHTMNTRYKHQLNRPTVTLLCIQKGVFYCTIKIFNSFPPYILKLKQKKPKFKVHSDRILLLILFTLYTSFYPPVKLLPLFNTNNVTNSNNNK